MTLELSEESRRTLLALARESITCCVEGRDRPAIPVGPEYAQPCGAFVTLEERKTGDLRGCIGHVAADGALGEVVSRMAVAAATEDGRFQPVRPEELPRLHIEISALGPLERIRPEDVVVGVHGLLIRHEGRTGLLLPQVAVDHGWAREAFLDATCRKARLPPGTWRDPRAELYGFRATVFGEDDDRLT